MATAPQEVKDLVTKFELNIDSYQNPAYNEAQVRQEFINPLFELLGWDMSNRSGHAEAYKDVIHEAAVKVGGETKAPDYAFRIGGTKKFFLEAKKPGIDLKKNPEPAYQLRRYAWSAGLPLSILTDFEEFAVYDCRIKPQPKDKASVARILYLTHQDYESRWQEISKVFSKQAVLKGSFDRYAETMKGKRGTSPVDEAFLKEIEEWRSELAQNLAQKNARLKVRELNFAVQRIIDRIIFLRMCEDRGIEEYKQLQILMNGVNVYERLKQLFYWADDKYNSGLFHFKPEKDRAEQPDELTDKLKIDDKVLKHIISRLYYPDSPYEFSVLSGDILGNVYEQFLGKVIHLTKTHQARIEEKPEVKKAGGVFYTPKYIVDYIVKNSIGTLCEGKTPRQIEKFRILDPACGSGSFLIGAYSYLLDYHRFWYEQNSTEKQKKEIFQGAGGHWHLTTKKKKEILLNNIFGLDIDNQAVEVTKLNLLLKVLEGETKDTLESQLKLWHRRALPDLGNNIKCGNSLIGPDYYQGKQLSFLDEEEKFKTNVFNWNTEFSEIIKSGGFDVIIGNPPYGAFLSPSIKDYLSKRFPFVSDFETSQYFVARSEQFAKQDSIISFIVPNTLFLNLFARRFRAYLLKHFLIQKIANLGNFEVFKKAKVRTAIPFFVKSRNVQLNQVKFMIFDTPTTSKLANEVTQRELEENDKIWISSFSNPNESNIRTRLSVNTTPLGEILKVSQGLIPYDKYRGHSKKTIKNRIWHSDRKKDDTYKRELQGGDVKRYLIRWNGKQWISYGPWLAAPRKPEFFNQPRLLFREITDPRLGQLYVGYTEEEFYNNPGIINCISRGSPYSLFYILGLANSRLLSYFHFSSSPKAKKGIFPKILVNDVRSLPIRLIEFSNQNDSSKHDEMVRLVKHMLELNNQLIASESPNEKIRLERQIEVTDLHINQLVYQLYGLTDKDIDIVAGKEELPIS